jgi:hypothetical protein
MKVYEVSVLNNGTWEVINVTATYKEDLARRVNSLSYGKINAIANYTVIDVFHESNVTKKEKYFKVEEKYFKQFEPKQEPKETNIKALGYLIALMGAELGRQQVNMSGGKMGNISHDKILKNSDVQFLLNC